MKLFGGTINTLESSLKYSTIKQNAIAQNIANVDTPNYKAKEVLKPFQHELKTAMQAQRTDARHFNFSNSQNSSGMVVTRASSQYNHNGNSVDIDKEMSELAENQIYYNALIDRINGKFNSLKTVISGGK
ncbi:flagellar basal-body rod protein FlgB [Bacillus mesophilus]|uniref:Flagellar basal body rod protein FlgB n=1 Tax=Bacillus mesophilus TaxID=1808955 RepID=A0A6M0Q1N5_9BACI|nr:flagellar basal body rod protein FlgB [Bacillus mesophilus]MBM7659369.1 flagellar basal-body rod protein FlgB [Bacillus mesophilus]NEY70241.1 flagellar basal body rod protein FlgB [Bacillus mesophilus]